MACNLLITVLNLDTSDYKTTLPQLWYNGNILWLVTTFSQFPLTSYNSDTDTESPSSGSSLCPKR